MSSCRAEKNYNPQPASCRPRKGLVLVVSLWLITTVAIFGIGLARITYAQCHFVKFRVDNFLIARTMDGLLLLSKYSRINDKTPAYDTLSEFSLEEEYKSGTCKVIYSLIDEGSKININRVRSSVLEKLPGIDKDKAIAIVNSTYRPFHAKEEILILDEIEEEDYIKIRDYITIYGGGRVNINTCSEDTMEFLGMDESLIERVIDFREGKYRDPDISGEGIFESSGGIINSLREAVFLSLKDEQMLVSLISKKILGVKSDNYEIKAAAYVHNKLIARYSIIFGKVKNKYRLLEWRQN